MLVSDINYIHSYKAYYAYIINILCCYLKKKNQVF